jgi:hypothetical protein
MYVVDGVVKVMQIAEAADDPAGDARPEVSCGSCCVRSNALARVVTPQVRAPTTLAHHALCRRGLPPQSRTCSSSSRSSKRASRGIGRGRGAHAKRMLLLRAANRLQRGSLNMRRARGTDANSPFAARNIEDSLRAARATRAIAGGVYKLVVR